MLVPVQLFRYIQKAFTNHWNLLGLVGGIGFSFLSGSPLIGLPLVAAAEIAWLGIVGTHPRFQQYVDVTENEVQSPLRCGGYCLLNRTDIRNLASRAAQRSGLTVRNRPPGILSSWP